MRMRTRKSKHFGYGRNPELDALPVAIQRGIIVRAAVAKDVLAATFKYYGYGDGFLGSLLVCGASFCVISENLTYSVLVIGVCAAATFIFFGLRHYYCKRVRTLFRKEVLRLIAMYLAGELNPVFPAPPPKPNLPPRPIAPPAPPTD